MNSISRHAPKDICKLLVGNKIDLPNRKISKKQGEELAKKFEV